MNRSLHFFYILIIMLSILIPFSSFAEIVILAPHDNDIVGRQIRVKGTAEIPRGHYLWLLARNSDFKPLWWPQREAEIDPKTRQWSATAVFGGHQDIGSPFDIGVIAVNQAGHTILMEYWIEAMRTGDWRPIQIPETSMSPVVIKVTKKTH